jgi:predicted dehydrogenase
MTERHILIVGFGSVGQRHAANLGRLGCRISCVDTRADRRDELKNEAGQGQPVGTFKNLGAALASQTYDGAVIATPTALHVEQTVMLLDAGIPVLLEKPVAVTLDDALILAAAKVRNSAPLLLGYTWRWWPPLIEVKQQLANGTIGKIIKVDFWMSAHLADWHPWEPLEDFFMSSKALGGGALLDESHWIDLANWFFGPPSHVFGRAEKLSDLPIDADDHVDINARYADGKRISVHLDLIGRPHEKTIRIVGTAGTLVWSAEPNEFRVGRSAEQSWQTTSFDCERNDMFVSVAEEFLRTLDGDEPSCTLDDGLSTMRVIEAVRRSGDEGREIALEEI